MPLSSHKKLLFSICVFFIVVSCLTAQEFLVQQSARSSGMAGAYSGIGDDANAISANSAGLIRLSRTQLVGSYTRYYTGANIPSMNEGSLFFSPYTWGKMFYGVGVSYFTHEIFGQQKATLSFGTELWRLKRKSAKSLNARIAAAMNGNLYRVEYNINNFSEDFDHNDPLFQNGYSKIAYSADLNVLGEIGPFSIGLGAYNILEPDISIRGGAEGGTYPRTVRVGLSYNFMNYVTPAVEIEIPVTSNETISDEMTYSFGAESWLVKRMIGVRAGLSSDFITAGLSLRTRGSWDIGIDYAVQMPLEAPMEIGQNHKVSFEIGMKQPIRIITDFIVDENSVETIPRLVSVGDEATVYATVSNIGDMDAKNIPVCMYYIEDGKGRVVDKVVIDKLDIGESKQVMLHFLPETRQYYDLFVAANDLGGKVPSLQKKILEYDYDNNTGTSRLACFNPPETGTIRTSKNELIISTVSKVREEIPMIPAVHFLHNSDNISASRFGPTLDIIAARLKKNPDVRLELRGYYNSETEWELGDDIALSRANAVREELITRGVDSKQLIVVKEGYDKSSERITKVTEKDRVLIQEENRVVELGASLQGPEKIGTYYYEDFGLLPERDDRIDFKANLKKMYSVLLDNPQLHVIFHGYSAESDRDSRRYAYIRAANFRDISLEWAPDWLRNRFLVVSSDGDEETPRVEAYVSADAIVFRPRGSTLSGETLEFTDLGTTEITIDTVVSETKIDSFAVVIREEGSETPFTVLETGKGMPPKMVEWNWFGTRGEAPDPDKNYFAEVFVSDEYGQTVTALSDPVTVKVDEQEERKELFLINFNFGKSNATSEYLEARVENLAQNLIERVKYLGPNARIKAIVVGHTDIVGTDEANRELALERAQKEYENLKSGLMTRLDLNSSEELQDWMIEHRVEISYEGRSSEEPMVISRFEEGYWLKELIGDNRRPEGRLVNRRVVLEILTITE